MAPASVFRRWFELDRKDAMNRMRREMGNAARLLEGDVDFGLKALKKASDVHYETFMATALLTLYWRFIQTLDAVDLMLTHGLAAPATVQMRTLAELGAQSRYLSMKNDERLAVAYLTFSWRKEIEHVETHQRRAERDGDTERATAFAELAQQLSKEYLEMSQRYPVVADVMREYGRIEAAEGEHSHPRWYWLYSNVRTVRRLFEETELGPIYDIDLRPWSDMAHGFVAVHDALQRDEAGTKGTLSPLRFATTQDWAPLAGNAHHIFIGVTQSFVDYFVKDMWPELDRHLLNVSDGRINSSKLAGYTMPFAEVLIRATSENEG